MLEWIVWLWNLPGFWLLPCAPPPAEYWTDPLEESVLLIFWYLGDGKMITLPRRKGQNMGIPLSTNMTAWLLWSLRLKEMYFVSKISNGLNAASLISVPISLLQPPFGYITYFPSSSITEKYISYTHTCMIAWFVLNQIIRSGSFSHVTVQELGHLTVPGWIAWDCIFHSESRRNRL